MTERSVELRSDTFTRPTGAMRRAMAEAEVGDDVWNEDPTVHRLEERAADLTGKEAALFLSSGTQGNLVGLLSHTRPGNEVIVGDRSHMFNCEAAGAAVVGGLQFQTLPNRDDGRLRPHEIQFAIRADDPHYPITGCVAIENTHNSCGGAVIRPDEMAEVAAVAHGAGIPVHLDGARVFNAAVALGLPVSALTQHVDSVTFCLSKGLGAPVGSLLCGTRDYIARAYRWRKLLGGAMRQVGVIAAAGLVALDDGIDRLAQDHVNARSLAEGLAHIPFISIEPERVESNLVFFDLDPAIDGDAFVERLAAHGVQVAFAGPRIRAVTSSEVDADDIDYALTWIARTVRDLSPAAV